MRWEEEILYPEDNEALVQAAPGLIDAAHPSPRPYGSFTEARAALRAAATYVSGEHSQ